MNRQQARKIAGAPGWAAGREVAGVEVVTDLVLLDEVAEILGRIDRRRYNGVSREPARDALRRARYCVTDAVQELTKIVQP